MSEVVANRAAGYLDRIARMAPLVREHAERSERQPGFGTGRYEVVGRVLLGLDPGSPII